MHDQRILHPEKFSFCSFPMKGFLWGIAILFCSFALTPSPMAANAGTPVMWGMTFHFYLSNIFAAVVETWYVARRMRRFSLPATFIIILFGNGGSAILGIVLLYIAGTSGGGGSFDGWHDRAIFSGLIGFTWIVSILAELPFFRMALHPSLAYRTVVITDVKAHVWSYGILVSFYALIGILYSAI